MVDLTDPTTWPLVDVLPLTRPDAKSLWPELGVLIRGRGLVIYLTDALTPGLGARLRECEKIYYNSVEEILAANWRVD